MIDSEKHVFVSDEEKSKQGEPGLPKESSFEDWGDLGAELRAGETGEESNQAEVIVAQGLENERRELAKDRESIKKMENAEARFLAALIKEGQDVDLAWSDDVRSGRQVDARELDEGKHAVNRVKMVLIEKGDRRRWTAYKPKSGEQARFDQSGEKEPRSQKEWLGSLIDVALHIGRTAKSTVKELDEGIGSVSEYIDGESGKEVDWKNSVAPDEIQRTADYHYIIGETDGHEGQFIVTPERKLDNIDHSEAFTDDVSAPLYSEAIIEVLNRDLPASAEVLSAASSLRNSPELLGALQGAFDVAFGSEKSKPRFTAFLGRLDKYLEEGAIPRDVKITKPKEEKGLN